MKSCPSKGLKKIISYCLVLLILQLNPLLLLAKSLKVTGSATIYSGNTGSAKNQALKNALRQAVEQGVGVFIDSNTLSQNYEVVKDEILSTSEGFVSGYDMVREGTTNGGTVYEVVLKVEVEEGRIKDKLSALRILHQKMGNKRLMLIYQSSDPHAVPRDNGAVQTTLGVVRDEFSRKGFRMFNESVMKEVYRAIEQEAIVDRPVDSLIAMALDQRAEIMVRMEMIGGKRDKKGGAFYAVKSTVRLGVYEASSGRQIADTVAEGKELSASKPGPYDWYKMLSKAGKRAGAEAARQAIVRIADFYQQSGEVGNAFLMVFRNYNFEDEDRILDYLENSPGFQQLTELKNTRGYLEIELFSSQQKSRLRRKIIRDLKDQEIELAVQSISGNRLVFINPNEMEEKPLPAAEKLESQ